MKFDDLDPDLPEQWTTDAVSRSGFDEQSLMFVWGKFVRYYQGKHKACMTDEAIAMWENWVVNERVAKNKTGKGSKGSNKGIHRANAFHQYAASQNDHDFSNPHPSAEQMELGLAEKRLLEQGEIPARLCHWAPEKINEVKKRYGIEA